jgi:hypothetical protein
MAGIGIPNPAPTMTGVGKQITKQPSQPTVGVGVTPQGSTSFVPEMPEHDKEFLLKRVGKGISPEDAVNELIGAKKREQTRYVASSPVLSTVEGYKEKAKTSQPTPEEPVNTDTTGMTPLQELTSAPSRGAEEGKQVASGRVALIQEELDKTTDPTKRRFLEDMMKASEQSQQIKGAIGEIAGTGFNLATKAFTPADLTKLPEVQELKLKMEEEQAQKKEQQLSELPPELRQAMEQPGILTQAYGKLSPELKQSLKEAGFNVEVLAQVAPALEALKLTKGFIPGLKAMRVESQLAKEGTKIAETIAPKQTISEVKQAVKEGRLVKGQKSILTGKKPDVIAPKPSGIKSQEVIQKRIKDASKMNQPQLYSALDNEIETVATKLKPEMQKVGIDDWRRTKIRQDYDAVKKTQLADETIDTALAKKAQKKFEEQFLNKVVPKKGQFSSVKNADDMWEIRKAYDNSVPSKVKDATDLSPKAYQDAKEIWLQNRRVLNKNMHEVLEESGSTAKAEFADMKSMFDAQDDILGNIKLDVKGKPGGIIPFAKKVGIGYVGAKAFEGITGKNIPFIP